ncbi:MAG: PAS domain S-box protein, partial [Bacteroidota bacterium]
MNEHKFNILKKEAEKLAGKIPEAKSVVSGLNKLLNELEVYQYELEAQNNEIKETRNALEELYNRYYGLFDAGPVGKLIPDDKLMVREVNNSAMKILGKSRQLIIERHIQLFISQKSKEQFSLALNNSIKTGNRAVVELFVKSNTHSDKYCRFYIEPFKHNNPDLYLTIAITDETEIRKIKDELDIAKEKFGILENLPDPVFVFAKEKVVYVNQAVKQVLGVDPESLIGFNIFSILNDELRELAIVNYTKKSDGEKTTNREMDFTKPDGTILNIMVNSRLINYSGETYSIGIVRDISDVKAKEAKLEESRKIYDIITSNMTDIIAQVDADGTVRYVSPSITNTLGIRPADIIGTSMFKYL